jgi:hypothetical protein
MSPTARTLKRLLAPFEKGNHTSMRKTMIDPTELARLERDSRNIVLGNPYMVISARMEGEVALNGDTWLSLLATAREHAEMVKWLHNLRLRLCLTGNIEMTQGDLDEINRMVGNHGLVALVKEEKLEECFRFNPTNWEELAEFVTSLRNAAPALLATAREHAELKKVVRYLLADVNEVGGRAPVAILGPRFHQLAALVKGVKT